MILPSQLSIESHAYAATIYVRGPLSLGVAAHAITTSCRLPSRVKAVCVDLRAVTVSDVDALMMLESLLLEWSRERRGVSRISPTRAVARDAFVAIPCAIRDAPDAHSGRKRDDRVVSTPPYPVR